MANDKKSSAIEFAASRTGLSGGRNFGHRRGMTTEKPKSFKKTMIRIWQYFGNERKFLTVILILVVISAAIGLAVPYFIGLAIDAISLEQGVEFKLLTIFVSVLVIAYVASSISMLFQGLLMAGVSQRIVLRLRTTLYKKLHSLPVSFFDTRTHGEVMSRLSNDIDNISVTISSTTTQLMSLFITITGSVIMMLVLSPILTIAAMVSIPLMYLLTSQVTKRTKPLFSKQQRLLGQLNGQIEENITGIMVIRAFNQEEATIDAFKDTNSSLCEVAKKANIISGLIMPLMNVINNFSFALVALFGGLMAYHGYISVGVIASFLTYSKQFGRPLIEISTIYNTLQTAVAGAERVFEVMDEKEEASDLVDALVLENPQGHVNFEHVSFSYNEHTPILKDISFDVKAGSKVALVGQTGAGKTTIVNLLTRFYDITEGSIKIDGVDIRDYTRDSLRRSFSIVLQDTYLFSGTIYDNIRYGNHNATDEEIKWAAKKACANHFIERLPQGYNTILTESGSNLSQGERQLLAISRAILLDAPILILDEATSSVDTRTELHIQEAMLELMKGRTSFIIAHRLSTIRDCDEIMVIHDGKLIEKGNHENLLSTDGIYSKMYKSQTNYL